ncbi:MAG: hypothetical protein HJJLKODD_02079 [Phycisphaerae bacterium]|nr:hypothetical protein [Phycisphaerae bacterium]
MATSKAEGDKVKVKCGCGAVLMAPKKAIGKKVKCPKCKKVLTVPDPGSTVDRMIYSLGDEEYNRPPLEEQPPPPPPVVTPHGTKLCPRCNAELAAVAVFCVKCGYHLETGLAVGGATKRESFFSKIFKKK